MQRKEPFPGKIFTPCVPERRFAGLFGCIARISCHSQLISDAWRANLAANWRFSRPRPLSGCMERKTCHGLTPGNAFREHFAIVERPGTHRGGILSRQGPRERTARVYCHCQSGQGRIRAQSRHRRTLGNASREHFAIVERLGTHQGIILPRPDAHAERPVRPCATAPAWPTAVAPSASPVCLRHPTSRRRWTAGVAGGSGVGGGTTR